MGELQQFNPLASQRLGIFDRYEVKKSQNRAEVEVAHAALDAYKKEVVASLAHEAAVREQSRSGYRAEHGIVLSAGLYDSLVTMSKGDAALAEFIAPIAIRGRDAIQRQV